MSLDHRRGGGGRVDQDAATLGEFDWWSSPEEINQTQYLLEKVRESWMDRGNAVGERGGDLGEEEEDSVRSGDGDQIFDRGDRRTGGEGGGGEEEVCSEALVKDPKGKATTTIAAKYFDKGAMKENTTNVNSPDGSTRLVGVVPLESGDEDLVKQRKSERDDHSSRNEEENVGKGVKKTETTWVTRFFRFQGTTLDTDPSRSRHRRLGGQGEDDQSTNDVTGLPRSEEDGEERIGGGGGSTVKPGEQAKGEPRPESGCIADRHHDKRIKEPVIKGSGGLRDDSAPPPLPTSKKVQKNRHHLPDQDANKQADEETERRVGHESEEKEKEEEDEDLLALCQGVDYSSDPILESQRGCPSPNGWGVEERKGQTDHNGFEIVFEVRDQDESHEGAAQHGPRSCGGGGGGRGGIKMLGDLEPEVRRFYLEQFPLNPSPPSAPWSPPKKGSPPGLEGSSRAGKRVDDGEGETTTTMVKKKKKTGEKTWANTKGGD
ncbi:hypothetical protein IE53DRAFT_384998 [Violaceomyces palustris]|uniref:Uncharacterized protein n=1 Tax=Violaceomyces palustris TaxID=1673888 RepID=A0ACD0P383_9BASI|nr:hypothetical protein IE53DRAFT_384998 [Violaceomyces palustris]